MPSIDWNKSDRTIQHRHGPCGLGNRVFSDPCTCTGHMVRPNTFWHWD